MQALILISVMVGLSTATHLTLLPYAYLADPLPVYHQSQNTRTGEHAYSYAGGPSAKEEVKGLDGVTRGSYSYVDAHGILQSVFYVADKGGFRVAATNLPTDDDLSVETAQVLLTENAYAEEHGKSVSSRRKRSLEENTEQNSNRDQSDERSKDSKESQADQSTSESVLVANSILLPKLLTTATSHQSQVQIHRNVKLETVEPESTVKIATVPYETVVLPSQIPLATSHQSQVQIHKNTRLEVPQTAAIVKAKEPVDVVHAPLTPIVPVATIKAYHVESVPVVATLPSYHENRIQLHRDLGIEGPDRKDAVKIKTQPVGVLHTPVAAVPVVPAVEAKEAVPIAVEPASNLATATVTTSVSSHGVSQIHGNSKINLATPILTEPTLLVRATPFSPLHTIVGFPVFRSYPYAHVSHYRTQVHTN